MDMSIDAWSNLFFNIFDLGAHQVPLLRMLCDRVGGFCFICPTEAKFLINPNGLLKKYSDGLLVKSNNKPKTRTKNDDSNRNGYDNAKTTTTTTTIKRTTSTTMTTTTASPFSLITTLF